MRSATNVRPSPWRFSSSPRSPDVNESQVSRDERNEYHGITVDRASRILDALGVSLKSAFEGPVLEKSTATS